MKECEKELEGTSRKDDVAPTASGYGIWQPKSEVVLKGA